MVHTEGYVAPGSGGSRAQHWTLRTSQWVAGGHARRSGLGTEWRDWDSTVLFEGMNPLTSALP
jgi:hypothetical protein